MNTAEDRAEIDRRGSPDRFGYEWATYSTILPESRGQLERWLGSTGLSSFRGRRVMDVGCGMGRNPHWFTEAGATSVLGVDVDDQSLEAARRNLKAFPTVRIEKCSVYDLDPAAQGTFDRVTCIGVLHHLAEPELGLQRMWRCVAPGGDLVLWCYAKEGNRLLLPVIQSLRFVGSNLPVAMSRTIAQGVTLAAWPAIRLLPWRTDYYRKLRSLSFRNVESIIFDQMLPHIAHYWTREDMERLVTKLDGGIPHVEFVQGNSWHARITRTPMS
ncbi:MAG TPA: class I SAM-dependent methyltransferase [Polyangiaceae bacterium]|nr:class I SAM-dependent methyltransferase [Polyangiaceae bacterium]